MCLFPNRVKINCVNIDNFQETDNILYVFSNTELTP